jgi:hypothetical protein
MGFSAQPRLLDSAPGAAINAGLNGAIAWASFRSQAAVPLSVDSIAAPGVTALGNAATVVFALVLIITCITFLIYRRSARRDAGAPPAIGAMAFYPTGLQITVSNTLLAFGGFVTAAVIWQRVVGTIEVGPATAAIVIACVAAIATAFAEARTKNAMLAIARQAR